MGGRGNEAGGLDDMNSWTTRVMALAVATAMAAPMGAQESQNLVATMTDWSVFVEETPSKECWGVTKPKESANTRDGQPVAVKRGDIFLFVTFRPASAGEISFTGGYSFAAGSTVGLEVDGQKYDLFTDGEWAWPGSKEDDATILAAMKRGNAAVLSARSGKGTKTLDTFSLRGFTAAMEDAAKRCG
jgi:hypothetical protein